ncbi:MAG: regulator of chromosome condensation [Pedosphaera sp.]|nr:regulator of chromosome condensation [Pedosphaera sp.]
MKTGHKTLAVWIALFAGLFVAANAGLAQVAFSVSPSVISNTYPGVITLNITGLTNSEKVTVEKWVDSNGNGSIDAGEFMMDTFRITDGGASVIGGVTNVNVPFDLNSATGAITTTLSFPPDMTLENMVGQYVFRVVSPTGRFSPVTTSFAITNATYSQSISGIVYSNGIAPLPYAVVVAQDPQANHPAGAVVADASGHYVLKLSPGTYNLITALPNYYYDQSLAPTVVLTNGMSATTNLFLTNGLPANTISGQVYDSSSSNGVGSVFLQFQSGGLFAIAFTDANGNYSAALAPAFWKIKPAKERLGRRAYVVSQNTFQVNATAGSVSNANLALQKGTALFYGRITDNASVPMANINFDASDMNNQLNAKGYSDANGNYAVAVLGTTNDQWYCSPNSSDALANYVLNNFMSTDVTNGQVIQQNFVALPVTARISGQVRDNLGNPVAGLSLYAYTFNGTYQSLNGNTDNSGNYSLGVASGSWIVNFSLGGESGLDTMGFSDLSGPHTVSVPPTNIVENITVYPLGTALISQPQRSSPTQFSFNVTGSVGVNYTLQVSTNLAATNWTPLYSFQLTNNPFALVDSHATNSPRFYRVLKGP